MTLTKIKTDGIQDDAVTSGKIPANAVGSSELADNAVDTAAIAANAVTASRIADSSVQEAKINNGAVTVHKIGPGSVNSSKIADATIGLDKLVHGTSSNDGKFLRANNGADPTFETITGTTINNNADNRVITGSGTANTLEGESAVTVNSGRLFIGNTNPAAAANADDLCLGNNDNSAESGITLGSNSASSIRWADGGNNSAAAIQYTHGGTNAFQISTEGAERMRINSSGVGIGTTNPDAPLTIHNSSDPEIRFGYNSSQDHRISWDGSKVFIHADPENANNSSAIALAVDGTARLYINDSEKVGIGTTSPANKLHLYESTSGSNYIHFSNSSTGISTSDGAQVGIDGNERLIVWQSENNDTRFATNNTERMRILAGGGLTFNGDTAAANALNDYEEGTFTPVVSVEGQSGNASLSLAIGRYVKIGRTVHIHIEFQLNGTPSGRTTGNAWQWSGFPFNPVQYNSTPSGGIRDYRYPMIVMNADTSSTYGSNGHFIFRIFDYTTAGRIEWQHSDLSLKNASLFMQDGVVVQFAVTYCTG